MKNYMVINNFYFSTESYKMFEIIEFIGSYCNIGLLIGVLILLLLRKQNNLMANQKNDLVRLDHYTSDLEGTLKTQRTEIYDLMKELKTTRTRVLDLIKRVELREAEHRDLTEKYDLINLERQSGLRRRSNV